MNTDESIPESPTCATCGAAMARRVNKRGFPFWGCTRWPDCEATIDIAEPSSSIASKPAVDEFRRHAALEILKTLLLDDKALRVLWEAYLCDRFPTRVAVDLADDLVRELQKR